MSRRIDLTQPLSEADKDYLRMMGKLSEIEENERVVEEKRKEDEARQAEEKSKAEAEAAAKPKTVTPAPAPAVPAVPPGKPATGTSK